MLINDINNREDLYGIIITELREYGIKFRKDKKNRGTQDRNMEKKIFCTSLHLQEITDAILISGGIVQIPKFVAEACQIILENVETEGLFRKAGSASRQKEIKASLEMGYPLGKLHHVIDVANILKSFFRDLPEALLPSGNIQESLLRCLLCGDKKVEILLMTCLLLPPLSLNTLVFFMQFLQTIALHSHTNKMSIRNLAIIFTPSLMPLAEIIGQRLNNHVKVITLLIENAQHIGNLSDHLLTKAQLVLGSIKVKTSDADKKKKKRRSGSLTRMFNGLKKIVGAFGSTENLEESVETVHKSVSPCLTKSVKKRKAIEIQAFSAKKKKDILSMQTDVGSLIPSTPLITKEIKKSRLSLGGKRSSKNAGPQAKQETSLLNNVKLMERRWSVIGAPWHRKKNHELKSDQPFDEILSNLSPVVSLPSLTTPRDDIDNVLCNRVLFPESILSSNTDNNTFGIGSLQIMNIEDNEDYVKIPKREYEAFKERVSAIETKISIEFDNIFASTNIQNENSIDSTDGVETVQDKYEKTLEETESMNNSSSTTNKLAKRLSRELKIRNSEENKVARSPSARKIGTIRRRSRENSGRALKKQSSNISRKPSFKTEIHIPDSRIVNESFYPKSNLKRGQPNTIQTGLRHTSPVKKLEDFDLKSENNISLSTSVEWTSADQFFGGGESSNNSTPIIKPQNVSDAKINVNKSIEATPQYVTRISVGLTTPMLPPTLPPKRTPMLGKTPTRPPKSNKPNGPMIITNKHLTPLLEQQSGRASIARIRSQNAGMVMEKAKLFNGLAVNDNSGSTLAPTNAHISRRNYNNSSPVNSTPSRRANIKSPNKIHRRKKMSAKKSQFFKTIRQSDLMSPELFHSAESTPVKTYTNELAKNKRKSTLRDDNLSIISPKIRKSLSTRPTNFIIKTPNKSDFNRIKTPMRTNFNSPARRSPRLIALNTNKF